MHPREDIAFQENMVMGKKPPKKTRKKPQVVYMPEDIDSNGVIRSGARPIPIEEAIASGMIADPRRQEVMMEGIVIPEEIEINVPPPTEETLENMNNKTLEQLTEHYLDEFIKCVKKEKEMGNDIKVVDQTKRELTCIDIERKEPQKSRSF